jgi:Hemerythrin HHE cation binding domain
MTNRIEKGIETIASEVMGVVKLAKGRVAGLTGVFAHLAREHGKVMGLLLRLKASSNPKLRAELFPVIRAELLAHEMGELAAVYPRFANHPELAVFAPRHERDANELEILVARLSSTTYDDPRWNDRLATLIAAVSRHATQEDEGFFPLASRVFGREISRAMLDEFEAAKTGAMKSLASRGKQVATAKQTTPATRRARSAAKARVESRGKPATKAVATRTVVTKRASASANRMASAKRTKAAARTGQKTSRPKAR